MMAASSPSLHCDTEENDTLVPQCEILAEGSNVSKILYDKCGLYPGHEEYITSWSQFEKRSLREGMTDDDRRYIKNVYDRTVSICVSYTSKGRPDTYMDGKTLYPYAELKGKRKPKRCGTGIIEWDFSYDVLGNSTDRPCPCHQCKTSGIKRKEYWRFKVLTAAHVIYDTSEAEHADFFAFYESEDQKEIHKLYGYRVFGLGYSEVKLSERDYCEIVCFAHELETANRLTKLLEESDNLSDRRGQWGSVGILISHPHGVWKHISVGNVLHCCHGYVNTDDEDVHYNELPSFKLKKGTRITWHSGGDDGALQRESSGRGSDVSGSQTSDEQVSLDVKPLQNMDQFGVVSTDEKDGSPKRVENFVILPFDAVVNIPPRSRYSWREVYHTTDDCLHDRFNLPPGSQLFSPDGETLPLPTNSKLLFSSSDDLVCETSLWIEKNVYFTYDIPTCPGTSGALLFSGFNRILNDKEFILHFGRSGDRNRSGLGRPI